MADTSLQGKRIAFLATEGVEQIELTRPWNDLEAAGASLELVSLETGEVQGYHHLEKGNRFPIDKTVQQVRAEDYDALVLPGGVANPDALRANSEAVSLVKTFAEQNKLIAAICHAPWTLIEADQVRGRTLTSFPSLKTDIINAGGSWVDEPVHHEGNLITSRKPDDLDDFCQEIIQTLAA